MKQVAERWKKMCKAEKAKWCFDPPVPKIRKKRAAGYTGLSSCGRTVPPKSLAGSSEAGLGRDQGGATRSEGTAHDVPPVQSMDSAEGACADKASGEDSLELRPAKVPRPSSAPPPSIPEIASRQTANIAKTEPNGMHGNFQGASNSVSMQGIQ